MRRPLCVLLCVLFALPLAARADDQRAVLTLRVNTVAKQDATVVLRDGDALVKRADLEQAGLLGFPFNGAGKPDDFVSLASLKPALVYRVDDVSLELDISVSAQHLGGTVVDFGPHQDIVLASPAKSAFLNYSLSASNQTGPAAAGEFGTHVGRGMFSSTFSASANRQYNSSITNWIVDSPQSDRRLTIGDVVLSTGDLGGTVAIAGFGLERYFGMNANIVRTALPQITGNTLTPSTADVYVNGVLYRHELLPPGQFDFQNLPVGQGPNNTTVVVTDAFGRRQSYSNDFYGSDALLAKGLSDFSYGVGILHPQFGEIGEHGAAAAARYSAGITNDLTAGGRFEASAGTLSGGPTFSLRLPGGTLGAQAAVSQSGGAAGSAAVLSYAHMDPRLSAAVSATVESPSYSSLSLAPSQDRPLTNVQLSVSRQLGKTAGITFSFYRQQDRDNGPQSVWQLSHTLQLSNTTLLQVSESVTGVRGQRTFGVQTALNFVPGHGLAASVNTQENAGQSSASVQVQRALQSQTPSFGYTLSATGASSGIAGFGTAEYRGQFGDYMLTAGDANGQSTAAVNLAGGLVFIGGHVFPTQSISDSYALVDTGGLAHVRIMANNVVAGRTNSHGYLVLSQLGSYMNNDISLVSSDMPLNYSIEDAARIVAPAYRSGQVVRFGVDPVRPVTGTLSVRTAHAILTPSYGVLVVDDAGKARRSDVGEGGEFYFDRLSAGLHHATVEFAGGTCAFDLTIPQSTSPFIKLGTVICQNGVRL